MPLSRESCEEWKRLGYPQLREARVWYDDGDGDGCYSMSELGGWTVMNRDCAGWVSIPTLEGLLVFLRDKLPEWFIQISDCGSCYEASIHNLIPSDQISAKKQAPTPLEALDAAGRAALQGAHHGDN